MKHALVCAAALSFLLAAAAAAQESGQAAQTVAGKWTFRMGQVAKLLVLNVDGRKLTGSLSSPDGSNTEKLEGEYADGKLRFVVKAEAMNRDGTDAGRVSITYAGQLMKDGSLAGTAAIEGFDSVKNWTAMRLK
jgi:hypothetical protein